MTVENDDRIRVFLADEARRASATAPSLDEATATLAPLLERRPTGMPRGLVAVCAAALLLAALGGTLAIGTGLIRLPVVNEVTPTLTHPEYEAVFLRLETAGTGREVIVVAVDAAGREREIDRLPEAWLTVDVGDGPLAPMGAVSTSGILAMPTGSFMDMRWRLHDLWNTDDAPIDVGGIVQDVEQLQGSPYFSFMQRPSVFWGPDDQVAIPWYNRVPDVSDTRSSGLDYWLTVVDGRTGSNREVDIPDNLRILPQWTADGSGVLLGEVQLAESTPIAVARADGTIESAEGIDASDPACRTHYQSGAELAVTSTRLDRVGDVEFACLSPDDGMIVFKFGIGDGSGRASAARPLAGVLVPGGTDWIEIRGSFAGWIEVRSVAPESSLEASATPEASLPALQLPGARAEPAGEYGWTGGLGSSTGLHRVVANPRSSQTQLTFAVADDCFAYGTDAEPAPVVTVAGLHGLYVEPYEDPAVMFMPPPRGAATTGAYALAVGDGTLCVYLTWDPNTTQDELDAARRIVESIRGQLFGEDSIRINFTLPEGWDTG